MSYLGIDFDSHAVHCVLLQEDGSARYLPFPLQGPDAFERTRAVRDAMPARTSWADEGVVACGIERPWGPNKGALLPVFGAILACLPAWLLVEAFEPARWRKVVGLAGNATKEQIVQFVMFDRFSNGLSAALSGKFERPESFPWGSQDACDAFCLALAVSGLTEGVAA